MSEPPEVKSDTRTARDLAGAETALRKAGWKRAIDLPVSNPTLNDIIDRHLAERDVLDKLIERSAKPNPVMEFFNSEGGKVAMEQLMPVLVGKLFGGETVTAREVPRTNPDEDALGDLDARVGAIEELLTKIAKKVGVE